MDNRDNRDYKREAADQFQNLRETFSRLVDQGIAYTGFGKGEGGASAQHVPVNVVEQGDTLIVTALVPGLRHADLDLRVQGTTLTIAGRERTEAGDGEGQVVRREWRPGPMYRSLELPFAVNPESADAALTDGVLTVRLTRAETARSYRVDVKTE